jgi:hypothetical protein
MALEFCSVFDLDVFILQWQVKLLTPDSILPHCECIMEPKMHVLIPTYNCMYCDLKTSAIWDSNDSICWITLDTDLMSYFNYHSPCAGYPGCSPHGGRSCQPVCDNENLTLNSSGDERVGCFHTPAHYRCHADEEFWVLQTGDALFAGRDVVCLFGWPVNRNKLYT